MSVTAYDFDHRWFGAMTTNPGQLASHRVQNTLQMGLIIVGLALVLAGPAWMLAGSTGVVWALLLVIVSVAFAGTVPPRLVLARSGAGPIRRHQAPDLYRLLEWLYERAGLRMQPALYYVPSAQLNAFAVGDRRDGGIAVTEGLLRNLSFRQLAGVLAHEVSHLSHNDTRVMAMAAAMTHLTAVGATIVQIILIVMLPWVLAGELFVHWLMLLGVAFAPSLSTLLQLALSRNREFTADLEAAALTGDPRGLAAALKVLERFKGSWLASLFGQKPVDRVPGWLQTHPPTGERIRRLLSLEPAQVPDALRGLPERDDAQRVRVLTRPRALALRDWLWR